MGKKVFMAFSISNFSSTEIFYVWLNLSDAEKKELRALKSHMQDFLCKLHDGIFKIWNWKVKTFLTLLSDLKWFGKSNFQRKIVNFKIMKEIKRIFISLIFTVLIFRTNLLI